jgi:preprotein translocase SecE subunit
VSSNLIHILVWTVIIAALFGYLWWQGQIKRLSVFWQETMTELYKCSWPSWIELRGSTLLIIISVLALGVFIFLVDIVLRYIFVNTLV